MRADRPTLQIGCTRLGVYFVYACSPLESFAETRALVPALRSIPISEWVDDAYAPLAERFALYLRRPDAPRP